MSFFMRSMNSLFQMKSSEVSGSSSPPQYFRSLVVVGGPPYSPGATPVDHFMGFFLGNRILVCLGSGTGGVAESGEMGVAVEVTERQWFRIAIAFFVDNESMTIKKELLLLMEHTSVIFVRSGPVYYLPIHMTHRTCRSILQ